MIAVGIRFPAGRFHATPWGRHVNEGASEWPPSPWRLHRAFVATWKRKLDADPCCAPEVVESLLRSIAASPVFALPPASTGHARHYMPWFKKGPGDKTLVFDAWVGLDKQSELLCLWPDVALGVAEREALGAIAANLGALGRAESWVEARVLSDQEAASAEARVNCAPVSGTSLGQGVEPVRILCVDADLAFANEHTPKQTRTEGRGKAKRHFEMPLYDPDWHLCMETLELHDKKWSDPPGATWVTYGRRTDCFAITTRRKRGAVQRLNPTVVRFALDGTVLPLAEDTLRIAEMARIVAMGCYRRVEERRFAPESPDDAPYIPRSEVFSGKDSLGRPLIGHRHAFYLPTDEDGDGRLDHLTIIADMGFGPSEVKALDRMRSLKHDHGEPVYLVLMAIGQEDTIVAKKVLEPSCVWESATPFIATRHAKARGRKKDPPELLGSHNQRAFAQQVLKEEIARLRQRRPDLPEPTAIEPLNDDHRCSAHHLRPIQFKRFRRKRGDDGGRRAAGAFRIVFPEPVRGPICLGHSAHFGLGLFIAVDEA